MFGYRALVGLLVCVTAVHATWRIAAKGRVSPAAPLATGDLISEISVEELPSAEAEWRAADLPLGEGGGCTLVWAFESSCRFALDRSVELLHDTTLGVNTGRLRVLLLSVHPGDAGVPGFLEKTHLAYPVFRLRHQDDALRLGVRVTPTMFFLDNSGRILGPGVPSLQEIDSLPKPCRAATTIPHT